MLDQIVGKVYSVGVATFIAAVGAAMASVAVEEGCDAITKVATTKERIKAVKRDLKKQAQ